MLGRVGLELVEDRRPLVRAGSCRGTGAGRTRPGPSPALRSGSTHWEKTIALRPLAATSSMSARSCSSLALAPVTRVEVANLLQPHDQLEDVLHGDRVAQARSGGRRPRSRPGRRPRAGPGSVPAAGRGSTLGGMSDCTSSLVRRRMQSPVRAGSRLAGVSCGMRPGSTNSKMLIRSSGRFSIGVPVMAHDRARLMDRTTWAVFESWFLIRWASSSTTRSNAARGSAQELGVAGQQSRS